jgi:methyl-accepting chemotaxis protein
LKLSTKINLSALSIFVVIVAFVAFISIQIQSLINYSEELDHRHLDYETVEEVKLLGTEVLLLSMDIIVDKDSGFVNSDRKESMVELFNKYESYKVDLKKISKRGKKESKLVESIVGSFDTMNSIITEKLYIAIQNRADDKVFSKIDDRLDVQGDKIHSYIKSLLHLKMLQLRKIRSDIEQFESSLIVYILVAVSLMLILFISISIYIIREIKSSVKVVIDSLHHSVDDMDISRDFDIHRDDEIGEIIDTLNLFMRKIREIFKNVYGDANENLSISNKLSELSQSVTKEIKKETKVLGSIAESGNTIKFSFDQSIIKSEESEEKLRLVGESLTEAKGSIVDLSGKIQGISQKQFELAQKLKKSEESVDMIRKTLQDIKSISEQTALLSLNASIEASRAGDYGKGFKVVADEVKELSDSIEESVKDIEKIIRNIVNTTTAVSNEMNGDLDSFNKLVTDSEETQSLINRGNSIMAETLNVLSVMISGYRKNTTELTNILDNVSTVNKSLHSSSLNIESIHHTSEDLNSVGSDIRSTVEQFKI